MGILGGRVDLTKSSSRISLVKRGDQTRARILETTLELMWSRGYGSVTVDGICEQAEIQKGSFYHFFRSKAEVAAAALDAYWDSIEPEFERIFGEKTIPPVQRIVNFFDSVYCRQLQRSKEKGQVMGCPFVTLGSEVIKHESLVSAKARELMDRYCLYFEQALREAQTNGQWPLADPGVKAKELYAYLVGCLVQARIRNDVGILRRLSAGVCPILSRSERESAGEIDQGDGLLTAEWTQELEDGRTPK
jgi:TetR/AcrR family transcriptional regulator, transcriptional repressor for nem operon